MGPIGVSTAVEALPTLVVAEERERRALEQPRVAVVDHGPVSDACHLCALIPQTRTVHRVPFCHLMLQLASLMRCTGNTAAIQAVNDTVNGTMRTSAEVLETLSRTTVRFRGRLPATKKNAYVMVVDETMNGVIAFESGDATQQHIHPECKGTRVALPGCTWMV